MPVNFFHHKSQVLKNDFIVVMNVSLFRNLFPQPRPFSVFFSDSTTYDAAMTLLLYATA